MPEIHAEPSSSALSTATCRYETIRAMTEQLAAPLSAEDCAVQSMPDASPTKWHLAHTTWFFETFVLQVHANGYRPFHPQFSYLFNSYYNRVGDRVARPSRGMLTRPSLDAVLEYRRHVDEAVAALLEAGPSFREVESIIEIGLNHEQQHQELILTDIKHLLSLNPLRPVYASRERSETHGSPPPPLEWIEHEGGLMEIGHDDGRGRGFAFDNESPRHRVYIQPFSLASRPVTNGEFLRFIEDGGYERAELWLDLGWTTMRQCGWSGPLYWERADRTWRQFTLAGLRPLVEGEPVCHVSYFEADAFARWAGARLPSEQEWEIAARELPIEGHFLESKRFHPDETQFEAGKLEIGTSASQMFGDVWEWTRSQYSPYPGYAPPPGALGEYNGKFMCNQFVLRGGSCATPASHVRATYRNFFPPEARWQFSGLRLARDST